METFAIAPQTVKPFVGIQKNDYRDAEAICEAGQRPGQRYVPLKSVAQSKLRAVHRIRERLMRDRTAAVNQLRGLLAEHGVIIGEGIKVLRRYLALQLAEDPRLAATPPGSNRRLRVAFAARALLHSG